MKIKSEFIVIPEIFHQLSFSLNFTVLSLLLHFHLHSHLYYNAQEKNSQCVCWDTWRHYEVTECRVSVNVS